MEDQLIIWKTKTKHKQTTLGSLTLPFYSPKRHTNNIFENILNSDTSNHFEESLGKCIYYLGVGGFSSMQNSDVIRKW